MISVILALGGYLQALLPSDINPLVFFARPHLLPLKATSSLRRNDVFLVDFNFLSHFEGLQFVGCVMGGSLHFHQLDKPDPCQLYVFP